MRIAALIVAAGSSTRFGAVMPKIYQKIGNKTVLQHAIMPFLHHTSVADVQLVIHPDHAALYDDATRGLQLPAPIMGGATRHDSVMRGLQALAARPNPPTHVLIHDAARPGIDNSVIDRVIATLAQGKVAVTPALPVADTLRATVDNGETAGDTVDRNTLRAIQTPQGFDLQALLAACAAVTDAASATDETSIMSQARHTVALVAGSPRNMKLTYTEDMAMLNAMLSKTITVSTTGIDIHPLAAKTPDNQKPMILGGVEIPSEHYLVGHSDADVLLHALCDAIYGALGDGDIGVHFPPSDMQWKDADSKRFVAHAMQKIADSDARLLHVDMTMLAERPRLSQYRDAIIQSVATLCNLPLSRIGLKATTTEKLGFIGRQEGVLAQVTITMEIPDNV